MIGKILTSSCHKLGGCALNIATGGVWGLATWLRHLLSNSEGKQTFLGRVMTFVIGHTIVSLLFGTLSFWGVFKLFAYALAGILWLSGWSTTPPEDDQSAIARASASAKAHAEELRRGLTEEAATKKKEWDEHIERLKDQHKREVEELARKFEAEKVTRDLADSVARVKRESDELKERTQHELKAKRDEAEREIAAKSKTLRRQAEEQAAQLKLEAEKQKAKLAVKAKKAASKAVFGSAGDVITSMEQTFTNNLNSFLSTPPQRDPKTKLIRCQACNKQWAWPRGETRSATCSCGASLSPDLPETN